jgi:hypothetical protein
MRKEILIENFNDLKRKLCESRSSSDETQSAVAQYACVAANGYFEAYIKKSMSDKYRSRCDSNAFRLVQKHIDSYYNFKSDKINQFVKNVWPNSSDVIQSYLKGNDEFTTAIGSLVGNKNQIAHSGSSNASSLRVQKWIETVLDHLDGFDEVYLN